MSLSTKDEIDTMFGCFFWACGIVFVAFLVFMFTVVGPSYSEREKKCDDAHGVIIKGGACVKKDSLVGY